MHLIHPAADCEIYAEVPLDLRAEVQRWMRAFTMADFTAGVGRGMARVAEIMGVAVPTARRKYDALLEHNGHWSALLDERRVRAARHADGTGNKEFRNFITGLAERHQRNSGAAYRKFLQAWAAREPIPGFEDLPGWPTPPFSKRTFYRILAAETDRRKLRSIRVGTTSKTNADLAQVFTTRVGLYPGAVLQIDDVWHDHMVMLGRDPRPRRVMELGLMDLFSGCRPYWGCMPRLEKPEGGMRNFRGPEMRFFMAGWLWNYGVHPRGTRIMLEHGTAALPADLIAMLHDSGLGISVDLQPIEGRQNALLNYWGGSQGGNFRAKAALESLHNLIHNDLSHLALQTGSPSSGLPAPHTTDVKAAWLEKTLRAIAEKAPHRLELFRRLGALDFYGEFVPLLKDFYDFGLNGRTDHCLEGWEQLGFIKTEYTAAPGSGHYLTDSQYLALPRESQFAISQAANANPSLWTRRRPLSPMEVWNSGRGELRRVPAPVICDILGRDLAREVTVKGSYIRFSDKEIAPEELIYEARATYLNGAQRELPSGAKFSALVLPFCPKNLFLLDARDRYIGHCELVQRVGTTDRSALLAAAGHKARRNAEIMQPMRVRHQEHTEAEAADRAFNQRLADPSLPVTEAEIAAIRDTTRDAAARRAAAKRLQAYGKPLDCDALPVPVAACEDPFAGLADDDHFPDSI